MKKNASNPLLFISYQSDVSRFVAKVCHCLVRQARISYYFHKEHASQGSFDKQLYAAMKNSNFFILFLTEKTGSSKWQNKELDRWVELYDDNLEKILIVNMNKKLLQVPRENLDKVERVLVKNPRDYLKSPLDCADEILHKLKLPIAPFDDLPTTIKERYEKDIINLYRKYKGVLPDEYIRKGYSPEWPRASVYRDKLISNPLNPERYGDHREDDSSISVDARFKRQLINTKSYDKKIELTFPEAGPRRKVLRPPNTLKIAILVSGGIAPGINAVISSIIERHLTYKEEYGKTKDHSLHNVKTFGCIEGFNSLCDVGGRMVTIDVDDIKAWVSRGGSVLPTARADQLLSEDPIEKSKLLNRIVDNLKNKEINILYIIGGEGSMRAAHAVWTTHNNMYPNVNLSVIGIPKTMDNDILWVWQSFGFLSAVEKARRDIIQLSTEATSNPRICIMQLFGSSSGYVVSHAALGSNVCDLALIPELDFNMKEVCEYMAKRLYKRIKYERTSDEMNRSPSGLIVMSETAIPKDFEKYMNKKYVGLSRDEKNILIDFARNNRKIRGQTPDELRSAGLKIVSRVLQKYINDVMGKGKTDALGDKSSFHPIGEPSPYWEKFRVFTNEPRHLIRSMEPTVNDVAYGIRLGTMAVDMALAGYTDCMVSQWLTEYVVVPLKLVVLGRKQVPKEGIFWKTVVSKTGQIEYKSLSGIL